MFALPLPPLVVLCCLPLCDPPHHCLCISLSSLSSGTHKPKDPPWLALVQSESKKKKAPAPPPAGQATPSFTGSVSSLKGEGSRPNTPPPSNPFEEDDDDNDDHDEDNSEDEEENGSEGSAIPAGVVASHPWYSISRPAEAPSADTPPAGGSSSRSASPGGTKSKKRPAPRAPKPPIGNQGKFNLSSHHHHFLAFISASVDWKKGETGISSAGHTAVRLHQYSFMFLQKRNINAMNEAPDYSS